MRSVKTLSLIIVLILMTSVLPVAALTENDGQSSFEYKEFEDNEVYTLALDMYMPRVYDSIAEKIEDGDTVPIPGLLRTNFSAEDAEVSSATYVPQGLCMADKYMLVTAYDAEKKSSSVIYAIDKEAKKLVSTLVVPNTYHLGGIAFDGNNIWLTGDTSDKYKGEPFVQYIRFSDFMRMIEDAVYEITADEISEPVYIKNKPSFLECDNGILWVGTYIGKSNSKKGFMNGYRIVEKENGPQLGTFMYSVLTGIDSSAQGADIEGDSLYVSSSYGGSAVALQSSFVTRYSLGDAKNGDTDLNMTDRELKRVEVPKMNEEIIVTDTGILMNFEAAADCWKFVVIPTDRILAVKSSLWR